MLKRVCAWLPVILLLSALFAFPAQVPDPQSSVIASSARLKLGQAGSQKELDDYNRLHAEVDPAVKKVLIDEFAEKYPQSGLLAYAYQDGVYLGRQVHNVETMEEYGEKSLDLWPDNYSLLTELGSAYVQRDRVYLAEVHAAKALELAGAADRPSHMTEQQWAEFTRTLRSTNLTTLGFVHLRRAQTRLDPQARKDEADSAIEAFRRALEITPVDDYVYYGLGFSYAILNDYPNAESNLAKAVAVGGVVMASARSLLEEIYKSRHNQSTEGLDQVIAHARAEIGSRPPSEV